MRTFHVSTFCRILPPEINRNMVMEMVEINIVINTLTPPDIVVMAGLLKIIAPNVEPILSHVNEVEHVPNLNRW